MVTNEDKMNMNNEQFKRYESEKKRQDKADARLWNLHRQQQNNSTKEEHKETAEEIKKSYLREKIAQKRISTIKKKILKRRLKRDKNITGLVRGLGQAFTPRVKISPQGRRALISQAVNQAEDYNARNTFFKKREGSKVSFLGRGNV